MHIETIHIERSGSLHGVTIDQLGPGVQVLHGTNETGKTSLLEFLRAMFFGFEGLFRRGVLDPQLPCAGRLVVHTGPEGRRLSIERRHEGPELATLTQASYEDDIVGLGGDHGDFISIKDIVPPPDGRPWNRPYLQDIVGDIDERTFTNVMAFGLDELHELRTLEPEGCGSRLYELASGLDRSKVTRVLRHIHEAMARLESSDPAVSPIESLRLRRHEVLDRLAALNAPAMAAGSLLAELARTDAELAMLEAAIERSVAEEDVVRGVLWLEPLYIGYRQTAAQLDAMMGTTLVHADLDAWKRGAKLRNKLARLARRRQRTRSRLARSLAEVPAESAIWKRRAAVAAVCEEQPKLERMVAEVARAESYARLAARRFGEQVGTAGLARIVAISGPLDAADTLPDVLLPEGFTQSFGPLKARARDCVVASRGVKQAKRGVAEAMGVLDDTRGLVKGGIGPKGMTIAEAIEEASGRATLFRNRLAAAAQMLELDRSIIRIDKEVATHLEGQLIPLGWLIALGAVFVTGAGMLLSGLLLPQTVTGPLAYALAALGLAGTGLASVTTWSLDRAASNRLEAARSQSEMVHKQREELLAQCGLLDKKIPVDTVNSLERRAALAQAEVERLEELAAREGSMHVLSDKVAVAKQALKRALSLRKAARLRWQKALEHRGLPITLSPREVKQIGLHRQTLLTLDDDRRRLSEEARHKREELAAVAKRIDELMVECDLVPEATPLEHLVQLREKLASESSAHRRRGSLTRKLERARASHRRGKKQLAVAEHHVKDFFTRWAVTNEQDFLDKVDRRPLFERTKLEAEAAEVAWLDARRRVNGPADLDQWLHAESVPVVIAELPGRGDVRRPLTPAKAGQAATTRLAAPVREQDPTATPLERRLAEACEATERLRSSLRLAADRRAGVAAKVDATARDRSTESLQSELADVEQQLAAQLDRRRLLERTGLLLEETRLTVARDHQPPVLREASHWLARLTDGRHTAITTTIDEARLEVHDRDGSVWKPERLSRGTREQVFLALRLALVRDLQRHGVPLPLVMDDALVNFDDDRARAAARVLVEFVADQPGEPQMLVFTCHAHVASIFAEANATVRSLSDPTRDWRRRPEPLALPTPLPPEPQPQQAAAPKPQPVVVSRPVTPPVHFQEVDPGAWPAEHFFFSPAGGYAAIRHREPGMPAGSRADESRQASAPRPTPRRSSGRTRRR
jgi:hypothetical protein